MNEKVILVTGATAGFGAAIARTFAREGWSLIVTGRRQQKLDEISEELRTLSGKTVRSLCFDVRILAEVEKAAQTIQQEFGKVDLLVNNAGLAVGMSPIDEGVVDDWERMIDTNVKGLLYMSKHIIPLLKKSEHPQIVNIGSTAGKDYYLNGNVYCATKHAVDALTRTMRVDLLPYGIKVTGVCPGLAHTEFSEVRFKGDQARADGVYQGYTPLYAEDIAEIVLFAATRPAHVNLNDIVVSCTAQADSYYIVKNGEMKKPVR